MKYEERQRLIKDKAIPIFIGLKIAEISAAIASTVGVYYYGVLALFLLGRPRPGYFLTWCIGLAALTTTLLVLIGAYLLIGHGWLIPNWNLAKRIAEKRLDGK